MLWPMVDQVSTITLADPNRLILKNVVIAFSFQDFPSHPARFEGRQLVKLCSRLEHFPLVEVFCNRLQLRLLWLCLLAPSPIASFRGNLMSACVHLAEVQVLGRLLHLHLGAMLSLMNCCSLPRQQMKLK